MRKTPMRLRALVLMASATWLALTASGKRRPAGAAAGASGRASRLRPHLHQRPRAEASDERYRRLVEQVDQVLFELDADGRWSFLNPAWEALTGHAPGAALGQPMVRSLHPDDRADTAALLGDLAGGRRTHGRAEVRVLTAEGASCWVEMRARAQGDGSGTRRVMGAIGDIGTHRRKAQELRDAHVRAERATAARSDFIRSMNHGLRTPLNGVMGMIELLATTPLDAQQQRYLSVARASAAHLGTLISDTVDLSRIDAGAFELERTVLDLPALVRSSMESAASVATERAVQLSISLPDDVPTWVMGDPGRIRQVLVSLLTNALELTAGDRLDVRCTAAVEERGRWVWLQLEVQHTVARAPAGRLAAWFGPTTSGDASLQLSGPGLARTMCVRLVELMAGTLAVRSHDGGGTAVVVVRIPLEIADAAMVEGRQGNPAAVRVLAVLPDEAERARVRALFEAWRLDADMAADSTAASNRLEAARGARAAYRVVLLDAGLADATALAGRIAQMTPGPDLVWVVDAASDVPAGLANAERLARPLDGTAVFETVMAIAARDASDDNGVVAPAWSIRPVVLVAEDHEVNQVVIRELLIGLGCEVDVVGDGEQAVAAALARGYDAILMDCQMPVLDGLEATRRIRRAARASHSGRPRIVALTAHASDEDRRACLDAGMDAYMTKPVRATVLRRTLERLLGAPPSEAGSPAERDASSRDDAEPPERPVRPAAPEDVIDPSEVLARCNNSGDVGAHMLQLFAASLPVELEALEASATAGDHQAAVAQAHRIRGAAATLAAVRLAGAIAGVELFLKHGDGGPLPELLADLRHESAAFLAAVPATVRRLTTGMQAPPD